MENELKLVEFDKWCDTCVYFNTDESKDPCNECLTITARENSHKPEFWKENKQ